MTIPRTAICGALFLLTLMSGVGLSLSGKPLDDVIFPLHRLSALLTVIAIAVKVYPHFIVAGVRGLAKRHIIPVSALLFLALFVSGALLGSGNPQPAATLAMHRITALLAMAATAGMTYQLARRSFS